MKLRPIKEQNSQPKPEPESRPESLLQSPSSLPESPPGGVSDSYLQGPDGAHLDTITVEGDGLGADLAPEEAAPAGPVLISREDFHTTFVGVFGVAKAFSGLQSLTVERDDSAAQGCAYAIYDIAEETPQLRFLIEPGGKWLPRIAAIGAFAAPMAINVNKELTARKAAKEAARRAARGMPEAAARSADPAPNPANLIPVE